MVFIEPVRLLRGRVFSADLQGCVVPLASPVAKVALLGMEVVTRMGTATLAMTKAKKAAFCTILSMHQDQVRRASDSSANFPRALWLAGCTRCSPERLYSSVVALSVNTFC